MNLQAGKKYLTRNNQTVLIFEVKDNNASANCHGYLHRITKTGRTKLVWNIWQPNGKFLFIGDSPLDIISEIV